jgi:hypothetical protein
MWCLCLSLAHLGSLPQPLAGLPGQAANRFVFASTEPRPSFPRTWTANTASTSQISRHMGCKEQHQSKELVVDP